MLPELQYVLVLLSSTEVQHWMVVKNGRKRSFVSAIYLTKKKILIQKLTPYLFEKVSPSLKPSINKNLTEHLTLRTTCKVKFGKRDINLPTIRMKDSLQHTVLYVYIYMYIYIYSSIDLYT